MDPSVAIWQAQDFLFPEAILAASRIIILATLALSVGVVIGSPAQMTHDSRRTTSVTSTFLQSRGLAYVGLASMLVALSLFSFVLLREGGVSLIAAGYSAWLDATQGTQAATGLVYLLMGFGLSLTLASRSTSHRKLAWILFGVWAVPALAIGLRGEVAFPAIAGLAVISRHRDIDWRYRYALIASGALALGSLIRVVRGETANWSLYDLNPLAGLSEMGYSIRPTIEAWKWHALFQEPFVGWRTYWATPERFLGHALGWQTPATANDPNVFNLAISSRVGTIGGSPVAEAFHSAGYGAVVVVLLGIGIALGVLDRLQSRPIKDAFVGGTLFIFLQWSRNDFVPVWPQFAGLVGLLTVAWALECAQLTTGRSPCTPANDPARFIAPTHRL